jgi:DNA-binding beta-propeller fold protein YncE
MRLILAAAIIATVSFQDGSAQAPFSLVGGIDLPGVEGRIDHLAADTAAQRLFVAALGNNTVEVLDLKNSAHVKSVPGFREPQGIAVLPDAKVVAVANGQGEGVQFITGTTTARPSPFCSEPIPTTSGTI